MCGSNSVAVARLWFLPVMFVVFIVVEKRVPAVLLSGPLKAGTTR